MTLFLTSFIHSILGKEINLPICTIERKKPIQVYYTYFQGKSSSHRLEFRKGSRTVFEMFLPQYDKEIMQFCSTVKRMNFNETVGEKGSCGVPRLMLWLSIGRIISCRELFSGPNSSFNTSSSQAKSSYLYRLAYGQKGNAFSILMVSSRHSSQSGTFRKESKNQYNWLKLSVTELQTLVNELSSFLSSQSFIAMKKSE
jgi:hypothetical protein